jgi:hypothetical protein
MLNRDNHQNFDCHGFSKFYQTGVGGKIEFERRGLFKILGQIANVIKHGEEPISMNTSPSGSDSSRKS